MTLALLLAGLGFAGEVSGVVRERGTGDPVPDATVQVRHSGGTLDLLLGSDGRFSVELEPGSVEISALSPLYAPLTRAVEVGEGAVAVDLFLTPVEPTDIVVEARRPSPHVSRQILDRERVEKTPGTYEDPVRLIQALPGVAVTREYSPASGDIVLRSADPSESRFYLDGVELPTLYHFQQYASVLHTRLLDEIAVYPSTFGPAYGDAVGGIVSASSREADPERLHGGVAASFVMAGGYLTAPISDAGAVSVSARRSYLDLVESGNDQFTVWPVFWDYLARYDHKLSADHRLSVTALGAGDSYARYAGDTALLDPVEQESNPEFAYDRSFHGGVLRSRDTFAAGRLDTTAAVVADGWAGTAPSASQDRREVVGSLRQEAVLLEGDRLALAGGFELKGVRLDRVADVDRAWPELEAEAPMLGRGVAVDEVLSRFQGGLWVEPRLTFGAATVQPGARLQGDTASGTWAVDPRLTVQGEVAPDLRVRAAAGRYTQAPALDALSPVTGDATLGLSRADEAAVGLDLAVAGRLEFGVDAWGKLLHDVLVEDAGEAPRAVDGAAWGVELTSRYRLRERFFTWLGVTLGRASRDGVPFDFDQPYAGSFVASWDFHPGWNAGLRYRIAAGLPYTPVLYGTYDGDADTWSPVLGAVNSARLPVYQKLDAHIERQWTFNRWKLVTYAEVWWVPPGANALYNVYSYDYSESALVAGPPILPLLGGRVEL